MEIVQFGNDDRAGLRRFVQFGRDIYRNEPRHVPPLRMELLGNRLLGQKGLLAADHPFHRKAEVRYFLAVSGATVTGRIAACENRVFTEFQEAGTGFFGFFECIDDKATAHALLDAAGRWLGKRGLTKILGPVNFDTTDNLGLLVDGFDTHHYMMTAWNPPYYAGLLESWGLTKAMDLVAQEVSVFPENEKDRQRHERMGRLVEKVKKRRGITFQRITTKNLRETVPILRQIYNGAWEKNYGFAPITEEDARMLEENLRIIVDESIILLVFVRGAPAAFIGVLADVNEMVPRRGGIMDTDLLRIVRIVRNRRRGTLLRAFAMGIMPQFRKIGVDIVLLHESFRIAHLKGRFRTCEISWLLETNDLIIRVGDFLGGSRTKTWRVYSRAFAPRH